MTSTPRIPASRIVVLMPNWLGDAVMATPFLQALRGLYPAAHIAAVARPLVAPVLAVPVVNETHVTSKKEEKALARWLRGQRFELAVLLPNSFRAAFTVFRAGIPHRLGYARGGRSLLLNHRLPALRRTPEQRAADQAKAVAIRQLGGPKLAIGSPFQPIPTVDYYLALAEYLGADNTTKQMELSVSSEEIAQAEAALSQIQGTKKHLVTLVPGANFGSSKCWPASHYAELAVRLVEAHEATVLFATSPAELPLVDAILDAIRARDVELAARNQIVALAKLNNGAGVSLGALKEIVRRSQLVICNDTGPRHFAAAFNIPTVTLFGPTDPVWAETYSANERIVRLEVPCGPCQLKKCPIDHRCMTQLGPALVLEAARQLLPSPRSAPSTGSLTP